jgi:post-segregation antitoxin (ccd killing protein)
MRPRNRAKLDEPIVVYRRPQKRDDRRPPAWAITSGRERVEAARALGLTTIEAIVEPAPAAEPAHAHTTKWATGDAAAAIGPAAAAEPAA